MGEVLSLKTPALPGWIPKPRRRSFKLTASMVMAGILILAGGLLINSNQFNSAKLTGFIGSIKNSSPKVVRPEPVIKKIPVSPPVVAEQTAAKSDIKTQKIPEENSEPKLNKERESILSDTIQLPSNERTKPRSNFSRL